MYGQAPFVDAANTPVLHAAFDQLVGQGRWLRRDSLGTFPVRFPSPDDPGDAGWHVDVSFGYDHPDFLEWRVNIRSRGRALLMLFLFSDVGEDDAPTRIRVGSHLEMARRLAPAGEAGLSLRELAADGFAGDGALPRGPGDGRSRHGLPVPPVPRPRRAAASRHAAAIHGAAAAAARVTGRTRFSSTATRPSNEPSSWHWRVDFGATSSQSRRAVMRLALPHHAVVPALVVASTLRIGGQAGPARHAAPPTVSPMAIRSRS